MYLQGSIEQGTAAYKELVEISSIIEVQVQPAKCAVYSTDSDAARTVAGQLGVRFVPSEEGVLVAGMPMDPTSSQSGMQTKSQTRLCVS